MQNSPTEHPCPFLISLPCWSSASRTPIFHSSVSIMNKFREQPWGHLFSSIVTSLFMKDIEIRVINTSPNPTPIMKKVCGWLPLLSRRQNTESSSSSTSSLQTLIPSLPQTRLEQMDSCLFCTPFSYLNQGGPWLQQCIGNQPKQITIYIGTATTAFLLSIVF